MIEQTSEPKKNGHLGYLLTAYLFDNLSAAGRTEVEAHLAGCAQCRAELEALRRTLGVAAKAFDSGGKEPVFEEQRRQRVMMETACHGRPGLAARILAWRRPVIWTTGALAASFLILFAYALISPFTTQMGKEMGMGESNSYAPPPTAKAASAKAYEESGGVDFLRGSVTELSRRVEVKTGEDHYSRYNALKAPESAPARAARPEAKSEVAKTADLQPTAMPAKGPAPAQPAVRWSADPMGRPVAAPTTAPPPPPSAEPEPAQATNREHGHGVPVADSAPETRGKQGGGTSGGKADPGEEEAALQEAPVEAAIKLVPLQTTLPKPTFEGRPSKVPGLETESNKPVAAEGKPAERGEKALKFAYKSLEAGQPREESDGAVALSGLSAGLSNGIGRGADKGPGKTPAKEKEVVTVEGISDLKTYAGAVSVPTTPGNKPVGGAAEGEKRLDEWDETTTTLFVNGNVGGGTLTVPGGSTAVPIPEGTTATEWGLLTGKKANQAPGEAEGLAERSASGGQNGGGRRLMVRRGGGARTEEQLGESDRRADGRKQEREKLAQTVDRELKDAQQEVSELRDQAGKEVSKEEIQKLKSEITQPKTATPAGDRSRRGAEVTNEGLTRAYTGLITTGNSLAKDQARAGDQPAAPAAGGQVALFFDDSKSVTIQPPEKKAVKDTFLATFDGDMDAELTVRNGRGVSGEHKKLSIAAKDDTTRRQEQAFKEHLELATNALRDQNQQLARGNAEVAAQTATQARVLEAKAGELRALKQELSEDRSRQGQDTGKLDQLGVVLEEKLQEVAKLSPDAGGGGTGAPQSGVRLGRVAGKFSFDEKARQDANQAAGVEVPADALKQAELGDHFETANPDRPVAGGGFGYAEARKRNVDAGLQSLDELIGVGSGTGLGTGGGWGGGAKDGKAPPVLGAQPVLGALFKSQKGKAVADPSALERTLRGYHYFRAENPQLTFRDFLRRPAPVPPPVLTDLGLDEDLYIERHGTRPFVDCARENRSTFGMDVDTASYTLTRSRLRDGKLPEPESVRVEEFLNYFKQPYTVSGDDAFGVFAEGAPEPFGSSAGILPAFYDAGGTPAIHDAGKMPAPQTGALQLLKIGIKSRDARPDERKPAMLTFVVDTSGSMVRDDRLELVCEALKGLVNDLAPDDAVAIVGFSSQAELALPRTQARHKQRILDAIASLEAHGATNVEAGLNLAYRIADESYSPDSVNRMILCSDGVANVGAKGPETMLKLVKVFAGRGIDLCTVGFGMGQYHDKMMMTLADNGNGTYHFVDSPAEARKVFREQLPPHLNVLAKDAKVQIEFNRDVVERFRLLGYEKRKIANKDFRNDSIVAGEVAHSTLVTAMYEIQRKPGSHGPLGKVYLRWKDAAYKQMVVVERNYPLSEGILVGDVRSASPDLRFLACVARFAELLRGSPWVRDSSYAAVLEQLQQLPAEFKERAEWKEVQELVARAQGLSVRQWLTEAR